MHFFFLDDFQSYIVSIEIYLYLYMVGELLWCDAFLIF